MARLEIWLAVLFFCILSCFIPLQLKAQRGTDIGDGIRSTQATDLHARPDAKKQGPKKRTYRYIIKSNSKNTLNGNKCFEEVTRKFGFEYLIALEDYRPNRNGFSRWMHNSGVKFILFFRNGPGWQIRMQKKYRECKYRYGDFTG
ncbi:MAG: hypothetical protein KFF73_01785 [Cyclobacteriaceae bacterium]|nr:hypothetical protein [Cyclobacteriaceae bacterium]